MSVRLSNSARLDTLEGRLDRIEGLLTTLVAGNTNTTPPVVVEAPVAAPVQEVLPMVNPTGAIFPAGHCQGCGKPGMISNPLCKGCRSGKAPKADKGTKTVPAAQVSTKAPAKGKGNPNHCKGERCNKFVAAGVDFCSIECSPVTQAPVQVAAPVSLGESAQEFAAKVLALQATGKFTPEQIAQILSA